MSLYTVAVPSRSPRGPPGVDVTLGWQRGEGLGPAAEGAGASMGLLLPIPRTVAVPYF